MCTKVMEKVPSFLEFWAGLYNAAPKVIIPGTQFPIGFTILFVIFFSSARFFYTYLHTQVFGFDFENPKTRLMIACSTSLTHSLILIPALWQALRCQPYKPSAPIANSPKYYQDAVTALLQVCTGYMVYDFIFMLAWNNWTVHPDDIAYIGHHIVTIAYMSQTRVLGAGHISAMGLMLTGEFTNPMQNTLAITRFAIQMATEDSFWHFIHPYAEFIYAVSYAFFRSVVGPLQIIHISYDLLTQEGRKNIPLYIGIIWIIMIWGIILGSMPWTVESIEMAMDGLQVKYNETYNYGPRYEL
jgi:hypothetical protein